MKKYIPNSRNYYITAKGRVYIGDRELSTKGGGKYAQVRVYSSVGVYTDQYVHRLVATAFIPNPENKPCVNHKDGNKRNNKVDNLEWVTYKENTQHAVETGLHPSGVNSPEAELTSEQVHGICKMLMERVRVKDIVAKTGVTQPVVSSIKNKTRYKDIANLYEFPPKNRALSDETVRWICRMMEDGKTNREIAKAYYGKFYRGCLDMIRHGRAYKEISKDYNI